MGIGMNIRRARKHAGLTQEQLADRAAVQQSDVSKWETDTALPELLSLVKVATVLRISINSLLVGMAPTYDAIVRDLPSHAGYVLQDGTRVLSQADFLQALGRHRKANVRSEGGEEHIPAILQGKAINPFISKEILEKSRPLKFRTPTGSMASGYRAELLPDVCEV